MGVLPRAGAPRGRPCLRARVTVGRSSFLPRLRAGARGARQGRPGGIFGAPRVEKSPRACISPLPAPRPARPSRLRNATADGHPTRRAGAATGPARGLPEGRSWRGFPGVGIRVGAFGPGVGAPPRAGKKAREGRSPSLAFFPAAPAMASSRCAPRRAFNASCPGNAARAAPLAARRSPPVSPCSPPYPYRAYRSTVYPAPPSPSPGCPRGTGSGSCPPGRGRARPRTPARPWT